MLRPIFMDPSFCDDRKGAAAKLVNSAVQSRGPPTARSATAQIGISARPVRQLGNMLHQLDRQTKVAMSAIGASRSLRHVRDGNSDVRPDAREG